MATTKERATHAARVRAWREKDKARKAVTAAIFGGPWDDAGFRQRLEALLRYSARLEAEASPPGRPG